MQKTKKRAKQTQGTGGRRGDAEEKINNKHALTRFLSSVSRLPNKGRDELHLSVTLNTSSPRSDELGFVNSSSREVGLQAKAFEIVLGRKKRRREKKREGEEVPLSSISISNGEDDG